MAIVFFILLALSFPLNSEEVLKKDEPYLWEGLSLQFPENVILKGFQRQAESSLKVFPAKNDQFFLVIRRFPRELGLDTEGPWKDAGFWKETNPTSVEIQKEGRKIKIYSAEQVRNNNSLMLSVWFWAEPRFNYWIWLARKKEGSTSEDFWKTGGFFQFQSKEP